MTRHADEPRLPAVPKARPPALDLPPPRVSIGMPVFNGRHYIERAVNSLLAQSFGDFELIVLDNASTDGTYEFALTLTGDPRFRVERNDRNIGWLRNFVKVVDLARGAYFMWAPVDDLWEPEFVARLVANLEQHPDVGVAMSATRRMRQAGDTKDIVRFGRSENPQHMGPLRRALKLGTFQKYNFYVNGLFRRPLLQQAVRHFPEGGAPERILLTQLALHSGFGCVDDVLYQRQLHDALHEERYPNEPYSRIVAKGLLGDLHFLRSLCVTLLASGVIPPYRKLYIPLIVAQFAGARAVSLFFRRSRSRFQTSQLIKAQEETIKRLEQERAETTRDLARQRKMIEELQGERAKFLTQLERQERGA